MNFSRPVIQTWKNIASIENKRFLESSKNLQDTQKRILLKIIKKNQNSRIGRHYNFSQIDSIEKFQNSIPEQNYDDYSPWIDRIRRGEQNILTKSKVVRFTPTSGSTGANKLIPVTKDLLKEFRRGIHPWIYNLFQASPDLMNGPAFWSISPHVQLKINSAIPIGFESDSSYLSGFFSRLMETTLSVPESVAGISDFETFRYITLLHLLRKEQTRILSVWNPSYLINLLDIFNNQKENLIRDIHDGKSETPNDSVSLHENIFRFSPDKKRARFLEGLENSTIYKAWPHLGLISAWEDGPAATPAFELKKRFPETPFQPKGLITTEAFISFPFIETQKTGHAISIRSHFFEFIPVDTDGNITNSNPLLIHEIEEGKLYTIFITTGGGFYRYRIYDIIQVTGKWQNIPLVRFTGKCDMISDLCGEKLSQGFVETILRKLFAEQPPPLFAMLAPEIKDKSIHYTLFLEAKESTNQVTPFLLDRYLRKNYHYDLARKAGQIQDPVICKVEHGAKIFLKQNILQGKKAGEIKPTPLHPGTFWRETFDSLKV